MAASTPKIIDIILGDAEISVRLNPVAVADGYTVQASTTSRFADIAATATAANADSLFVLTGLQNGERYKVRAFSTNGGTNSFAYKARGFYLPSGDVLPQLGTPTLTATTISSTQIDLSSSAVTNATSYKFERSLNVGFTSGVTTLQQTSSRTFSDTGRAASTQYFYRVTAMASGYVNSVPGTANATTSADGIGGTITGYFVQTDSATPPNEAAILAGTSFTITTHNGNFVTTIPNIGSKYIHVAEPSTETAKTITNDTLGDAAINGENAFATISTQGAFRVYSSNYATAFDNPITWKVS